MALVLKNLLRPNPNGQRTRPSLTLAEILEPTWKIQPGDQGMPLRTCGVTDPWKPSRGWFLTGTILSPRGRLEMSADTFGSRSWGHWWYWCPVKPKMLQTSYNAQGRSRDNYSAPNVNSAEAERPCIRGTEKSRDHRTSCRRLSLRAVT